MKLYITCITIFAFCFLVACNNSTTPTPNADSEQETSAIEKVEQLEESKADVKSEKSSNTIATQAELKTTTTQLKKTADVAEAEMRDSVNQHGITWHFDRPYPTGQFLNGDYWVVGPITLHGVSNSLNEKRFTPKPGENGSMLNPDAESVQGYDNRIHSYKEEFNAGLIDGKSIAKDNPLIIQPHSSFISMVSWLYNSKDDAEKGIPKFNGGTKAPRPVTRSAAVLTVLPEVPPKESFRPAYTGKDKTIKFTKADIDWEKLLTLTPPTNALTPSQVHKNMNATWIDHVHEYLGAMIHPSKHMPNYGNEMAKIMLHAALALHMDYSQDEKEALLITFLQYGIDCTGICDVGGGWPANGGHGTGRKLPILFAGAVFNNAHMLSVGNWETRFHEDEQTFYVEQRDIDMSHSSKWNPDKRAKDKMKYTKEFIGMPEWGIRHVSKQWTDNRGWSTPYRSINMATLPGYALVASMMNLRKEWNHDALFDYSRRIMHSVNAKYVRKRGTNSPTKFIESAWDAFAEDYVQPIEWKENWSFEFATNTPQ